MAELALIVPGPIDQLTGGYLFDRRLVDESRAAGRTIRVIELPGSFPVVDGAGKVRWTFCGVGAETGYSTREQLERLLAPTAPDTAAGTIRTPGPAPAGSMPRP